MRSHSDSENHLLNARSRLKSDLAKVQEALFLRVAYSKCWVTHTREKRVHSHTKRLDSVLLLEKKYKIN